MRSAWARVARTAGPLLELRVRNWMPASSVAMAIAPPRASTSLTRWPLPIPPIDGLQDIWPNVSRLCVSRSARQRGCGAGVAAADHDDVEARGEVHDSGGFCCAGAVRQAPIVHGAGDRALGASDEAWLRRHRRRLR